MKQYKSYTILLVLLMSTVFLSCKKDDFKPIDLSELNPDDPLQNSALDQWLKTTFLDPYNINVVYRYNRYYHEADRNVSPPKPEVVQPMMQTVLDAYIRPYEKVAGQTFVKVNVPKEWILFGSTSYDGSGTGYAGTASGGVRITLFGLNNFSLSPAFVTSRAKTIHHEFVHTLNQRFIMPADFQEITKSTYNGDWKNTHIDSAHKWGYVSSYASQNPTEDYAETASALLVSGQGWYDNWVKTSSSDAGKAALRAKELNVVDYYNSSLGIDFRALQKEVQSYIKNVLKEPSVTFPYWLNQGLYKTITINLNDPMYNAYGISSEFKDAYNELYDSIWNFSTASRYRMDFLQFRFESPTSLVVRANFTATQGGSAGTQFSGDYSFAVAITPSSGEVKFTKIEQGSGTTFNNGNIFLETFENTIQAFLESDTFIGDYMPALGPASMYNKTAGFTQKNNATNFIYGPLSQQL